MNLQRITPGVLKRYLTVKAIQYDTFGGPEVLKIGKREILELKPNQVRIKVEYSALNRKIFRIWPNVTSPILSLNSEKFQKFGF